MRLSFLILFSFIYLHVNAQKKLQISGGIDVYYAINPLDLNQYQAPVYVSSNQLNSLAINLGLIEFKYLPSKRFRVQFSPAFGTYMQANYSSEKKYLRWIYESYAGFSFGRRKSNWIDAGVFSSPYTFETPKSWDHPIYTRALAPEFVPYYITGLRYQNELTKELKLSLFLMNGWQKIGLNKQIPSFGTQLEFKKNQNYLNWTTYSGKESSGQHPEFGLRLFSELSWAFENKSIKTQACIYSGWQSIQNKSAQNWWQINGLIDFKLSPKSDIVIRQEYFHDPNKIQIQTSLNSLGFSGSVTSIGYTFKPTSNMLLRFEEKNLIAGKETDLFFRNGLQTNWLPLLFANLTIVF